MAAGSGSDKVRVPTAIKFVLQLMIQHAHSHTSVLDMLDLSGVSWKSNPGSAVEALLRRAGLDWSADGKRLWRVSDYTVVIEWSPSAAPKTLRPASRASTAREAVQAAGLEHDASAAKVVGSKAQQRAAKAAELVPPRALAANASAPAPVISYACVQCDYDLCAECGDAMMS